MTFDLPNLMPFVIAFFALAAVATVVAVGALASFFIENHPVRVRRHEGIAHYYGHLVLGH